MLSEFLGILWTFVDRVDWSHYLNCLSYLSTSFWGCPIIFGLFAVPERNLWRGCMRCISYVIFSLQFFRIFFNLIFNNIFLEVLCWKHNLFLWFINLLNECVLFLRDKGYGTLIFRNNYFGNQCLWKSEIEQNIKRVFITWHPTTHWNERTSSNHHENCTSAQFYPELNHRNYI